MFDFLPTAEPVPLAEAPLVQVVAQVRFNAQGTLSNAQGVSVLHDALADDYPRLLSEQQAVITATPGGVATGATPQWRFTDLQGGWAIIVAPESLALETSRYATWSDMRDRLVAALSALSEITKPRVRERIGLRYVNHVRADDDHSFVGHVHPQLLGLGALNGWPDSTIVSLTQLVLNDAGTQMALRYGTGLAVPRGVFVVDIDCYDDRPVEFEKDATLNYFDQLNDSAYRCFCFCLPSQYRTSLRGG